MNRCSGLAKCGVAEERIMLTSAECRQRAEQKIAEAELEPRHQERLRTAAEGQSHKLDRDLGIALAASLGPAILDRDGRQRYRRRERDSRLIVQTL